MKSIKIFATVGAIALLGMTGFTSCNQKNGPVGPGNYNGEVVKTEFVINIPEAGNSAASDGAVLRMPADKTQTDANPTAHFLGMDNIFLVPYNTANNADITSSDKRWSTTTISLDPITTSGDGALQNTTNNVNYRKYSNVTIPLGTNHFLFYAHGTSTGENTASKFEYGRLDVATSGFTGENTGFSFSPVRIYSGTLSTDAKALLDYLDGIANATDGTTAWKSHSNDAIKELRRLFTTNKAGSARSILALVEDLYNTLEVYDNTIYSTTSAHDAVIQAVMTAILGAADESDANRVIKIKTAATGNNVFEWKSGVTFASFPRIVGSTEINLPDGAAVLAWDNDNNKFGFGNTHEWEAANSTSTLDVAKVGDYVYPAGLYYYANSGINTATSEKLANAATATSWSDFLTSNYTEANKTSVAPSTRSVAIVNQIQYAVAALVTSVKAGPADNFKDSKEAPYDLSSNVITMTGVLVGGQGPVGFDFAPASAGTKIIFDSIMTAAVSPATYNLSNSAYTQANPTLVLQTVDNATTGKVRMAVEFINKGHDFYGVNGIIPKNTKFYIVAELDPSALSASNKSTEMGNRVFMQDYTTTVKLTLSDLKKAYNVIPDLRMEQLELGFSVNLSWQAGHVFDITL